MIRRIWAVVSARDFYAFQHKAKEEGLDMGPALAALAHMYANDASLSLTPYKSIFKKLTEEHLKEKLKLSDEEGDDARSFMVPEKGRAV